MHYRNWCTVYTVPCTWCALYRVLVCALYCTLFCTRSARTSQSIMIIHTKLTNLHTVFTQFVTNNRRDPHTTPGRSIRKLSHQRRQRQKHKDKWSGREVVLTSLRLYMITEDWKRRAFVIPIPQNVRYLSNIFSSLAVNGPSSSFLFITWATPTICEIVYIRHAQSLYILRASSFALKSRCKSWCMLPYSFDLRPRSVKFLSNLAHSLTTTFCTSTWKLFNLHQYTTSV